jgi:cyclophilin family peptidyl-prolyl cis-trans isomerase
MNAIGKRLMGIFKSGSHQLSRSARRAKRFEFELIDLERRDVPAVLGDFSNVSIPANTGLPVTITGGTGPQIYSVSSDNPNITPSIISGKFMTLNISHNSSGVGDPQIDNQTMTYQLFNQLTPITTSRIEQLVNTDFYTGKTFHRIASGFPDSASYILQGGSANGDGTGEVPLPGFPFQDEFVQSLIFDGKYQLAMANAGPDTNTSQFFVTTGQPQFLNYKHTIFAQMVEGQSLVDEMTKIALNGTTPKNPVTINSASLSDTNNNGVLLINATGAGVGQSANITVTATDPADNSTVTKTFTVNMITSPVVNRAFLAPVSLQPSYKTDVTASFVLQPGNPQPTAVYNYVVASGVTTDPATGKKTFTPVTNATVKIDQASGLVQITPQAGFSGDIPLLVGIRDGVDRSGTGDVNDVSNYDTQNITMNFSPNAPTPPVAVPQVVVRGTQQEIKEIQLSGVPGDPNVPTILTYTLNTNPTNGKLVNFDSLTGKVTYEPNTGYIGSDSFTFSVKDQNGLSSTPASVTIEAIGGITRAVRVEDNVLIVTPPPGPASNTVQIVPVGNLIRIIVNGVIDNNQPLASNISRIMLFGSKRSDTLSIDPAITIPATISGGMGGRNTLTAGGGVTTIQGWFGRMNTVKGGPNNDRLFGQAGKIQFVKSGGKDTMLAAQPTTPTKPPRGTFYKWVRNRLVPKPAPKPLPFRTRI